jgi:phosphoglycerate kinase
MKTVTDFSFEGKRALIRVDFNVPLNDAFEVTDNTRIEAAKPTIIKVLEDGGSCVLMSHLGRPTKREDQFSLRHIVTEIEDIIGVEVTFISDCIGDEAILATQKLQPGEIILLENLRYYDEEKNGNKNFAEKLSALGDIYVNDAFGTAHRAHASTAIIANFFPDRKCYGLLLASEIENINKVLHNSTKPVTAIVGGAKISSKIAIILNILDKIDHLIIGGGMAFTFIKALGGNIGSSIMEEEKLSLALEILKEAKHTDTTVHLPVDAIIADSFSSTANINISLIDSIPDGWMGLDIGPESIDLFSKVICKSKTILWNGPLGVFEMNSFANGTIQLGNSIAESTKKGAFSLVGGGDSVSAVRKFNFSDKVSYVSTGGGAMLEMLEGKTLPGIKALEG